jgi:hypothetical protein
MNQHDDPEDALQALKETFKNYLSWLAAFAAVIAVFSLDSDNDPEEGLPPGATTKQNVVGKLVTLLLQRVCLIASLAVSTALVAYAVVGTWEWIVSPSSGFRFGQSWFNPPSWLLLILWLLTPFTYYLYGFVVQTLWDKIKK